MLRPSGTHQCNPKFPKMPLKLNEFESVIHTEYDNSNAFFRNLENEEELYQNFTCQEISYVIILNENSAGIIIVNV